jgi:hypothetical protein
MHYPERLQQPARTGAKCGDGELNVHNVWLPSHHDVT